MGVAQAYAENGRTIVPSLTGRNYGLWILVCGVAELTGLAVATAWWLFADNANPEPAQLSAKFGMVFAKSLAGVPEGLVLGLAQGLVLRRVYTRLDLVPFVLMTILVAVFGWAAGSAVSVVGDFENGMAIEPPLWWTALFAALFGLVAGALFGAAQWVALRRAAEPAVWWIISNAAGWAVALPIVYVAASFDFGENPAFTFALAMGAGLVAGACVAGATGLAFFKMRPAIA